MRERSREATMNKENVLSVEIGEDGRTYRAGDFLNALDQLVCAFTQTDKMAESEVIGALKLYTENMEGWQ